jgi:hypothetical protein
MAPLQVVVEAALGNTLTFARGWVETVRREPGGRRCWDRRLPDVEGFYEQLLCISVSRDARSEVGSNITVGAEVEYHPEAWRW